MDTGTFKQKLEDAKKLPYRERIKAFRSLGYIVMEAFKSSEDPSISDLDVYIDILRFLHKAPSPPSSLNKCLSKIIAKRLALLGCETPKILLKKSRIIHIDAGTIAVGDMAYAEDIDSYILKTRSTEESPIKSHLYSLELMNQGKMFFFGTGGDGMFYFQLRIIEAPEPVLTAKEYKLVLDSTPIVVLDFPSGKLDLQDGMLFKNFEPVLQFDIVPGRYKCQVHHFLFPKKPRQNETKDEIEDETSFYIVLCKTDAPAVNEVKEIAGFS